MIIYTFCVDIGKFSPQQLTDAAVIFVNALVATKTRIKQLIIYTNYDLIIPKVTFPVSIRPYEPLQVGVHQGDGWANLNLNKFTYNTLLRDEFGVSPVWIDLDTIALNNLDHLDPLPNFFVCKGGDADGNIRSVIKDTNAYDVPACDYLNGSVFKLDAPIHAAASRCVEEHRENLVFAEQGALNFVYHFAPRDFPMHVLGKDVDLNSINSYSAWESRSGTHPSHQNSRNLFRDWRGRLRSRLHPDKRLQFLTLTFATHAAFLAMKPRDNLFAWTLHDLLLRQQRPRWRTRLWLTWELWTLRRRTVIQDWRARLRSC